MLKIINAPRSWGAVKGVIYEHEVGDIVSWEEQICVVVGVVPPQHPGVIDTLKIADKNSGELVSHAKASNCATHSSTLARAKEVEFRDWKQSKGYQY